MSANGLTLPAGRRAILGPGVEARELPNGDIEIEAESSLERIFERLTKSYPFGVAVGLTLTRSSDGGYYATALSEKGGIDAATGPSPSSALAALAERLGVK